MRTIREFDDFSRDEETEAKAGHAIGLRIGLREASEKLELLLLAETATAILDIDQDPEFLIRIDGW